MKEKREIFRDMLMVNNRNAVPFNLTLSSDTGSALAGMVLRKRVWPTPLLLAAWIIHEAKLHERPVSVKLARAYAAITEESCLLRYSALLHITFGGGARKMLPRIYWHCRSVSRWKSIGGRWCNEWHLLLTSTRSLLNLRETDLTGETCSPYRI